MFSSWVSPVPIPVSVSRRGRVARLRFSSPEQLSLWVALLRGFPRLMGRFSFRFGLCQSCILVVFHVSSSPLLPAL